ncbi:MAG: UDP-N-acetylmuramoyl-tripeptide--D-alanyl-D-alanine ligase [Acidimicrobiales bacterium]|nr:UDP-N-acetylmuramoyl-tripeptide--D-alanyl-D-alanine ligase [Acidimicrobiales bacterium]
MRWDLGELVELLGSGEPPENAALEITGVSIDSRSVKPGDLFVPIVAERDGHDFVGAAIDAGAVAYLRSTADPVDPRVSSIAVDDTGAALMKLGAAARDRLEAHVVGVTGSVGKTSVKDLIGAVCEEHAVTHVSVASFNNELGVPLTLLAAPDDAEVVVIEMGARDVGHIELLCGIARPTVGVVTAVAAVHTEIFGSIEQVAAAKGELAEALPTEGTLVLNADDPVVADMVHRSGASEVVTYGATQRADVTFADVEVGADLRPTFTLSTPGGEARLTLGVAGAHMAQNAAAAAAVATVAGVPLEAILRGLAKPALSPHRMDVRITPSGATVIDDSYNANPTSMAAALDALSAVEAERRIAVLGVMAELGATAADDHLAIIERARAAGIQTIAVDAELYGPAAIHVHDVRSAVHAVGPLGHTDAVLVKGSRVAGLERVAEALMAVESDLS